MHQQGLRPELVERSTDWEALGAGIAVQPNGIRVLKQLGLDGAVVQAGSIIERWLFADQDGSSLCEIELKDAWGDVGPFVGISRAKLQEALVSGTNRVPTWPRGRVVLIGDAAHAVSPMMGQGGCMAMEDALVLAELLTSQPPVDDALTLFIDRRVPRVAWVQEQSRAVGASFGLPSRQRNTFLRDRGAEAFKSRYRPLASLP